MKPSTLQHGGMQKMNELINAKLTNTLDFAEQLKRATLYDEQRANKEELLCIADNQITLLMQVMQLLEVEDKNK